jgi:hypothetical protein
VTRRLPDDLHRFLGCPQTPARATPATGGHRPALASFCRTATVRAWTLRHAGAGVASGPIRQRHGLAPASVRKSFSDPDLFRFAHRPLSFRKPNPGSLFLSVLPVNPWISWKPTRAPPASSATQSASGPTCQRLWLRLCGYKTFVPVSVFPGNSRNCLYFL